MVAKINNNYFKIKDKLRSTLLVVLTFETLIGSSLECVYMLTNNINLLGNDWDILRIYAF